MRIWLLVPLLLAGCMKGQELGPVSRHYAVTGAEAHDGHPAVGRLRVDGNVRCGATLIGPRTALTSAHCVAEKGALDILLDSDETLPVSQAIVHPEYDDGDYSTWGGTRFFDLAVLLLDGSGPIDPLPLSAEPVRRGLPVVLIGFGATDCVDVDGSTDATICEGAGPKRRGENTVKQVFQHEFSIEGDSNACRGDSGSPILATVEQREVIAGIPARGSRPCSELSLATRIDVFVDWIRQQSSDTIAAIGSGSNKGDGGISAADSSPFAGDATAPSDEKLANNLAGDALAGGCVLGRGEALGPSALFVIVLLLGRIRRRDQ